MVAGDLSGGDEGAERDGQVEHTGESGDFRYVNSSLV